VQSGHWPLYRYRPGEDGATQPLTLDSAPPSIPFADFANSETRYSILKRSDPDQSELLQSLAQSDVTARWRYYEQLAHVERTAPVHVASTTIPDTEDEP
jgi:pyruvate-ferredoxin/flavodoxin oxidoreductase